MLGGSSRDSAVFSLAGLHRVTFAAIPRMISKQKVHPKIRKDGKPC